MPWTGLRLALRRLIHAPLFTAVTLLTLAVGIGANTAIFSLVNGLLLRRLPFHEPERLMRVYETVPARSVDRVPVSVPNLIDWMNQNQTFEGIAGLRHSGYNLTGQGEPQRINGARITANLLPLLGMAPLLGRNFSAEEEVFGKDRVVLLGQGLWQRLFGSDPGVLGRSLLLDGESYTVIGVMPSLFRLPDTRAELWTPVGWQPSELQERGSHSWQVLGRLKPGVTREQALSEMNGIARRLGEQFEEARDFGVNVVGLREDMVGETRRPVLILFGAVGCVLLIACANVANLLLARAASRTREFAVRAALGAGRAQVIRQLLTESLLLALLGGALGVLIGWWGVTAMVKLAPANARLEGVAVNWVVLGFTLGLSVLTGLVFGLVPALQWWRADVTEVLKEGSRGSTEGLGRNRVRSTLVIVEVALSLVLLAGAGLLLRSFARVSAVDPGFNPHHLLTANVAPPEKKYPGEQRQAAMIGEVVERARQLPGVESAAAVFGLPFGGTVSRVRFLVEGRPPPAPNEPSDALYRQITPGYFETLRAPLLGGRDFTARDTTNAPRVAIVNEAFVRTFFPSADPHTVPSTRIDLDGGTNTWIQIVGVVRDMRDANLAQAAEPQLFVPLTQRCWGFATVVVRTAGAPESLAPAIREVLQTIDPEQPLERVRSLESLLDDTLTQRRIQTVLLGVFSALALVLAAVGIYGVMAWSVSRRSHEIGVRMALGAQWSDVRRLVLRQGMALTLMGVVLGLVAGLGLARFLAGLLYEVQPHDPPTFGTVTLALIAVALLACWLPARRAARVDPMVALRS